jgi:hypothetical protein
MQGRAAQMQIFVRLCRFVVQAQTAAPAYHAVAVLRDVWCEAEYTGCGISQLTENVLQCIVALMVFTK